MWPEQWRQRHFDDRELLLRGLARIRAEEARPTVPSWQAETSSAATMSRVQKVTDLDPTMPFGIPAGELR